MKAIRLGSTTFEQMPESDGWYVGSVPEAAPPDVSSFEVLALELQAAATAKGFYCICGMTGSDGYHLYLVPAKGVRSVIEAFAVGSHGGDDVDSVFEQLAAANAVNSLVPYFADAAGLKARFSKPVTPELISLLEDSLLSAEPMMDEDEGSIAAYVEENRGIHLWWD